MDNMLQKDGQALLAGLAESWKPEDIRNLANTLLHLADSLDQDWQGPQARSIFRWHNSLARIERNAINLAMKAKLIYDERRKRREYISPDLLGEPAWDMLLELFMQFAGGAKVSTTSLCIASDCPTTTALRYISQLEQSGYVKRSTSGYDRRVNFVELTDKGVLSVGQYLEQRS